MKQDSRNYVEIKTLFVLKYYLASASTIEFEQKTLEMSLMKFLTHKINQGIGFFFAINNECVFREHASLNSVNLP
jgi:hypothetical protein